MTREKNKREEQEKRTREAIGNDWHEGIHYVGQHGASVSKDTETKRWGRIGGVFISGASDAGLPGHDERGLSY